MHSHKRCQLSKTVISWLLITANIRLFTALDRHCHRLSLSSVVQSIVIYIEFSHLICSAV